MWEDFLTIFLNISFLTQQKRILIGCSWGEIVTHEMLNVAKYLLVREYLKDMSYWSIEEPVVAKVEELHKHKLVYYDAKSFFYKHSFKHLFQTEIRWLP